MIKQEYLPLSKRAKEYVLIGGSAHGKRLRLALKPGAILTVPKPVSTCNLADASYQETLDTIFDRDEYRRCAQPGVLLFHPKKSPHRAG